LRVGGPLTSGGLNTANISGTLIQPGFGFPSPTLVSIIRKTQGGGQYTIRVDLDLAQRDRRERILIQPKDLLILQETPRKPSLVTSCRPSSSNTCTRSSTMATPWGPSSVISPSP